MIDWLDSLFNSDPGIGPSGAKTIFFILLLAFVIGHAIAWVYMLTHHGLSYSRSFVASLLVIPVIVAMMMVMMSGSLVVAFGMLAVFAVVRFRNVLKDTRDTTYVLWAIMEGLGVGTMRYSPSVIGVVGIGIIFIYLWITSFGIRHRYNAVLSLQLTGDLASGVQDLRQILQNHALRSHCASERRLTDQGLDLSYRLFLRDPTRVDELRRDLTDNASFAQVALFLREEESEV